jgi:hypothetical protein
MQTRSKYRLFSNSFNSNKEEEEEEEEEEG